MHPNGPYITDIMVCMYARRTGYGTTVLLLLCLLQIQQCSAPAIVDETYTRDRCCRRFAETCAAAR